MRNSIAIMNTKGGVGKSTLVMALAETLSAYHGKTVLVIDSDAQASVSSMLMSVPSLYQLQSKGETIVEYLVAAVLHGQTPDWTAFVVEKASDVDDARSVYVIPSDMQLTLFEREVSKGNLHVRLRTAIATLLAQASAVFDIVLIDCPPGLSVLTECWLREAAFHISPTKADYVSVCGLEVFRRFKALNPEMGFAENLGVVVNLKEQGSESDASYHQWLMDQPENRCFVQSIPRVGALQDAARYHSLERSYGAKYPGVVGHALRALAVEVLQRRSGVTVSVAAPEAAVAAGRVAAAQSPHAPPAPGPHPIATAMATVHAVTAPIPTLPQVETPLVGSDGEPASAAAATAAGPTSSAA